MASRLFGRTWLDGLARVGLRPRARPFGHVEIAPRSMEVLVGTVVSTDPTGSR